MAQAARLSLRMQKELKLLITDPPPGASFPLLSSSSSAAAAPSLTSIDAQIQGPEGTVYEKGLFKLQIRIPERYPFQPPIVTFLTPIYHPNIDGGGRICLDILNLPPKGAWQPSLNISTVLTSIGLLLSEPNPDDGLMCDASREYKYNKHIFDQKARDMTQKHAMAGGSGSGCSGVTSIKSNIEPINTEIQKSNDFSKKCSSGLEIVIENNTDVKRPTEGSSEKFSDYRTKRKLSLHASSCSSSEDFPLPESCNTEQKVSEKGYGYGIGNYCVNTAKPNRLSLGGRNKTFLAEIGFSEDCKNDYKENITAVLPLTHIKSLYGESSTTSSMVSKDDKKRMHIASDEDDCIPLQNNESVIVLDSEDSEEEQDNVPSRTRLCLARKPLKKKGKRTKS
ncbi:probable ubiquitin-conjugating enzyme E2 37 [Impatiens glandulifera]|uniref:probable ubiquitin-conjugating enzyme E2 37 n=1 Tax=Impatiens glandulifera TaxID=253017 RepID=UPI001FB09795|nr:probable ubiquitin-conjugating enzyme E2 37 [Impatiens glandulifera]